MFEKGQAIVHPGYGAGMIVDVRDATVAGEVTTYYHIDLIDEGTLMIPVDQAEEAGLRPASDADKILEVLTDEPLELSSNYRSRQARIKKKISSGNPIKIAEALRDLVWRGHIGKLSSRDMQLRMKAKKLLIGELAVQPRFDPETAASEVNTALEQTIEVQEAASD